MADAKRLIIGPPISSSYAGTITGFSNHSADATTDGIGWLVQAMTANAITHIGFRYGARTGTPPTYVLTLESPTTAGAPDGADIGGGSPTAVTFTPPADTTWDGTWQWVALTNSYTPSAIGQFLCPTIRYSSGTVDASNFSSFTTDLTATMIGSSGASFPNVQRLTAGTWAKRVGFPVYGVRTASDRYGYIIKSHYNTRSASTVGHRQAMQFTLPDVCDTFKIRGFRMSGSIAQTTAKAPLAKLWSASSALQSVTLDSDYAASTNVSCTVHEFYFPDSLTALSPGTAYYIGLEVADAASAGVLINGIQLDNAADLAAYPGGANFFFSTYNGSVWADDQTVRPMIELLFDDITEPAGGGAAIGLNNVIGG